MYGANYIFMPTRQNVNVVTAFDHRRVFIRFFRSSSRHVPHITALVFSTGSPPSMAEMEEESSISLRQVI